MEESKASRTLRFYCQGVAGFFAAEIGYEARILLNRDPSQMSTLAMHFVFRVTHK